jgi:hypothetical protein
VSIRITRAGIKTVARFVAARSVSTSISLLVHHNTLPSTRIETASVHIGAFVLGEMVGDLTKPYVDKQIDAIGDTIDRAHAEAKTNR